MLFRVIANQGRKLTAYGLFSANHALFRAILEDPSQAGRQFLVSSSGESVALPAWADQAEADHFMHQWSDDLSGESVDSPAIRCLFYAAYEAASLIETLPAAKSAVQGPLLWRHEPHFSLCFEGDKIYLAAQNNEIIDFIDSLLSSPTIQTPFDKKSHDIASSTRSDASYKQAVAAVKAYIAAGDIFQANIARFWSMDFASTELPELYDHLRRVNSAPFSSFVRMGEGENELQLLSASPERLFRLHANGEVDTRPIAGTRRRAEGDLDDSLKAELLLSEKERAEHIMLVDLERNDLGRICVPGSVEVDECMVVEQYATVQHIVSNVRGSVADGCGVIDIFRAMFPGGTITGCPKVRCMEIIHELEHNARGPYTGGLGYVAWNGAADMNILIRTFWHYHSELHWAAGAGIVADSDPQQELIETDHKVEGLLRAIV
ncbi:MAG: chorismate-binding protein [Mariprofundus sp.]|nr:chorismate-binding protein [Mariprofundus sp.]